MRSASQKEHAKINEDFHKQLEDVSFLSSFPLALARNGTRTFPVSI